MPPDRDDAPRQGTTALFPKITDHGLDDLRRRIGVEITDTLEPWCHEATRDGIRHYAHGIGDDNPLWCDPAYAKGTRWGGVIAPPSFLFATSRIVSGYVGGLPGVHAMWAGADWTWHLPVRRNDEITTKAWLKDLVEHETAFAGRAIQQIYHVDFSNQRGELVAAADSWCFRTDRDLAREHGTKYTEVKAKPPKRYTDEELAEVYRLYASEEVRGARPALLGRRARGRPAAHDGEGPDDGHRLHRLRPGLGRPLHPRQQARVEADQPPLRARHQEPLRHPRLSRARALGARVRDDGGRAGRLRLRPGALLVADPPPDELDGRRRHPAPRALQDPPPQSRGRHAAHRRHRRAASASRTAATWSRSSRKRATRTASCRSSGGGVVELPVAR